MLNLDLIDPIAFAKEKKVQEGTFKLVELDERVRSHEHLSSCVDVEGQYQLQGGQDKWARLFLQLSITLDLSLICQRCLRALPFGIDETSRIYLFVNETTLDEAMAQDDDLDGVVAEKEMSIQTLIEDEILMALPYAPKHDHCNNPDLDLINQDKPNPFSVLSNFKS